MRTAIYQYLSQNMSHVKWIQPYHATANTPKPYGVIVIGERIRAPLNNRASYLGLTIWLYVEEGSYLPLDNLVKELKNLLDKKILKTVNGNSFMVEWEHDGRDWYDDDLKAATKYIEFIIPMGG
jgi:hypothetical protein